MKTLIFTTLALLAFAANSVFCRLALGNQQIDPISFTSIRLLSGAIFLGGLVMFTTKEKLPLEKGSWGSALWLFIYALTFSFAYMSLETGVGALILFTCVQATMITITLLRGDSLNLKEWCGIVLAFTGFFYLLAPSGSAPSIEGTILMALSGIAWGIYSLAGKKSKTPLIDTAYNFIRTLPFITIIAITALYFNTVSASNNGIVYAILSGVLASGLGYTAWYYALSGLSNIQASIVQLLVPVIAAIGGVLWVGESFTSRLSIASATILFGVYLLIVAKKQPNHSQ